METRMIVWGVICSGIIGTLLWVGSADAKQPRGGPPRGGPPRGGPPRGGLPACQTTLRTCEANLNSYQTTLGTCQINLGAFKANLGICQADLGTLAGDLGTCQTDLGTLAGDLGICQADLGTLEANLGICQADLGTCQIDLGICQEDVKTLEADLEMCQMDKEALEEELETCQIQAQAFPATGQTSCWDSAGNPIACDGTGHDGDIRAGAPLSFTDNDDGTITDNNTGLMWEKLCDEFPFGLTCPAEHNARNTYSWESAFAKIETLNTMCFATYCDWRLPNVKELLSIVNYNFDPAVSPAFNDKCDQSPCAATECSCTAGDIGGRYWSSTSSVNEPSRAWIVVFIPRPTNVFYGDKNSRLIVRAVRGGQ